MARLQLEVSSLLGGSRGGTRPLCGETLQELSRHLNELKTGVFSPVGDGIWGLNVLEQQGSLAPKLCRVENRMGKVLPEDAASGRARRAVTEGGGHGFGPLPVVLGCVARSHLM